MFISGLENGFKKPTADYGDFCLTTAIGQIDTVFNKTYSH